MPRFFKTLLIWLLFFNWPPLVVLVPPLRLVAFVPLLFWINIPGLFLATLLGPPMFKVEEFGALPSGPIAWGLLALFWVLVAVLFTLVNNPINRLLQRKKAPSE
jgi:hypothetical protein